MTRVACTFGMHRITEAWCQAKRLRHRMPTGQRLVGLFGVAIGVVTSGPRASVAQQCPAEPVGTGRSNVVVSVTVDNLTNVNGTLFFSTDTDRLSPRSCGRATARRPAPSGWCVFTRTPRVTSRARQT